MFCMFLDMFSSMFKYARVFVSAGVWGCKPKLHME